MDATEATPIQVARLQTILSMPLRTDTPEILTLLERLAAAEVSAETLVETRALAAVSSRFLRCHRDKRIRAQSQELIEQWRAFATGTDEEEHSASESTITTISTPSSAVVAPSGGLATVGATVATADTLADRDVDAPAPPRAGSPTEAASDGAGHRSAKPAPDFGTMSAVDFLARCSAQLQRQQRKASRRNTELRKLGSGGFSPRRDPQAKAKHEQRRKDKKVKPTIDKKQNKLGSALVMRVGAESRAAWGGVPN